MGLVVESLGISQYKVKLHGLERITPMNMVFLKRITPYMSSREVRGPWRLRGGSIPGELSQRQGCLSGSWWIK